MLFWSVSVIWLNYRDFSKKFQLFFSPTLHLQNLSLCFKITSYSQVSFIYILRFFLLPVLDPAYCWLDGEKHESFNYCQEHCHYRPEATLYLVLWGWRETARSMGPEPDCLARILTSSVISCSRWPLAHYLTLQCLRVFICKMRIKMALNSQRCYGDKLIFIK